MEKSKKRTFYLDGLMLEISDYPKKLQNSEESEESPKVELKLKSNSVEIFNIKVFANDGQILVSCPDKTKKIAVYIPKTKSIKKPSYFNQIFQFPPETSEPSQSDKNSKLLEIRSTGSTENRNTLKRISEKLKGKNDDKDVKELQNESVASSILEFDRDTDEFINSRIRKAKKPLLGSISEKFNPKKRNPTFIKEAKKGQDVPIVFKRSVSKNGIIGSESDQPHSEHGSSMADDLNGIF